MKTIKHRDEYERNTVASFHATTVKEKESAWIHIAPAENSDGCTSVWVAADGYNHRLVFHTEYLHNFFNTLNTASAMREETTVSIRGNSGSGHIDGRLTEPEQSGESTLFLTVHHSGKSFELKLYVPDDSTFTPITRLLNS